MAFPLTFPWTLDWIYAAVSHLDFSPSNSEIVHYFCLDHRYLSQFLSCKRHPNNVRWTEMNWTLNLSKWSYHCSYSEAWEKAFSSMCCVSLTSHLLSAYSLFFSLHLTPPSFSLRGTREFYFPKITPMLPVHTSHPLYPFSLY